MQPSLCQVGLAVGPLLFTPDDGRLLLAEHQLSVGYLKQQRQKLTNACDRSHGWLAQEPSDEALYEAQRQLNL